MRARARLVVVVLLAVSALTAGTRAHRAREPSPREHARGLFDAAVEFRLQGQAEREFATLVAAFTADPSYVPAWLHITRHPQLMYFRDDWYPQLAGVLAATNDTALASCARLLFNTVRGQHFKYDVSARVSDAASDCGTILDILAADVADARTASRILDLWRRHPESSEIAWLMPECVSGNAAVCAVASELEKDLAHARHVLLVQRRTHLEISRLRAAGRDSAAAARQVKFESWLAGQPPPVRLEYMLRVGQPVPAELTRHADRTNRVLAAYTANVRAYNDGRLRESHAGWSLLLRQFPHNDFAVSTAYVFIGRTHLKAGELHAARRALRAAAGPAARSGNVNALIEIPHNLLHVYEALGQRDSALATGAQYLERARVRGRASTRLTAHHDLGLFHWRFGQYQEARRHFRQMLAVIDTLGRYHHFAGEYFERTGDLRRAMTMYERALHEAENRARSQARLAALALQLGDSARAIRLASAHDSELNPNYPEWAPLLPGVLAQVADAQTAYVAAGHAMQNAAARNQAAALATLGVMRATLALDLRRDAEARALARQAAVRARSVAARETEIIARAVASFPDAGAMGRMADAERTRDLNVALPLRSLQGDAAARTGDHRAALAAYALAADLNDSLANSFANDADRARFRGARNDVSARALQLILAHDRNRVDEFVAWSVRRKARGISTAAPEEPMPVPAATSAIVDYVVLDTMVAAAVFTRERQRVVVLPIKPRELRGAVETLRTALVPRIGLAIDVQRAEFDARLARDLGSRLIAPLMPALQGKRDLVVVPDGVLHNLPFELLIPGDSAGSFLIQTFNVRYAPSLVLAGSTRHRTPRSLVAVGGSAPGAAAELRALRQLPFRFTAISTESSLRRHVGRADIIHLAVHAAPNDAAPPFAHLALAGDVHEDGVLHTFEIEDLRWNGALIVLSGCDTGIGRIAGGEGVLSLSRAFLRAGASATVATLWPIGEGSAELMGEFYRQLAVGLPPAEALRQAKLRALQGRFAHPLFWAPFILVGS